VAPATNEKVEKEDTNDAHPFCNACKNHGTGAAPGGLQYRKITLALYYE
jgi:hypothetical protein